MMVNFVMVQTVPDPPILSDPCVGTTLNTATVSWKDGALDGGSPITYYTIFYRVFGLTGTGSSMSVPISTPVDLMGYRQFTVTGLSPGSSYVFEV
jgi:hypothetical protein